MKIAVNTRMLLREHLDGKGRFANETLERITKAHPEHEFYFLFDRPYDPKFIYSSNITPVVVGPVTNKQISYAWWHEITLNKQLEKIKPDLFLSPDGFMPLRSKVKSVAVIHDLSFEHLPHLMPLVMRSYHRTLFPQFARKATRVATVSEFSKRDIAETYNILAEKIDVVYNGASCCFKPLSEEQKEVVKNHYSRDCDFFLFVGVLLPRKNLVNLLKAFDEFKKYDNRGIKLVMAGARKWWSEDMQAAYDQMQYRGDVIFTGRITDKELAGLMGSALALTYVSYYEGFGIPMLEAFKSDTPVMASNVTSLPEIAGDAAILIDPHSTESICNAMKRMANEPALRQQLIEAGRLQREKFSWDKTADKLWQCMEKAMQ